MKNAVIFFLFIIFSTNSLSAQTKSESQVWVKSTVEQYVNKQMYQLLNIYFDDGGKSMSAVEMLGNKIYYKKMFLKDVNQITILETSGGYEMRLTCAFKKSYCCETGLYVPNSTGSVDTIPDKDPKTGMTIYLDRSLKDENMIARLKKAISHLIKLNGGKVISDTF